MANPAYGVSGETIGSTVKPVGPGMLPGASFFFLWATGDRILDFAPESSRFRYGDWPEHAARVVLGLSGGLVGMKYRCAGNRLFC